jgi:hypothetical protein
VPAAEGTPLMEPVIELSANPGGKLPALMLNRYGADPPLTELTAL